MAYDEDLAARVRERVGERLAGHGPAEEKRMFGGLAFMVNTHMAVSVHGGGGLLVPVGVAGEAEAFDRGAVPMSMGDKEMRGWVQVPGDRVADDADLAWWVDAAVDAALGKPAKAPRKARRS